MRPRLPPSAYVIAALALLLLWAVHVIGKQQAQLDARPLVESFKVDARTEDVRRGPVRISRTTTTAPDGTKTTTSTREIAAEERHTEVKTEASYKETPAPLRHTPKTRYVGQGVNPLDYTRQWRGRGGLTVLGALDAGVAVDLDPARLKFDRPMVELTYRF